MSDLYFRKIALVTVGECWEGREADRGRHGPSKEVLKVSSAATEEEQWIPDILWRWPPARGLGGWVTSSLTTDGDAAGCGRNSQEVRLTGPEMHLARRRRAGRAHRVYIAWSVNPLETQTQQPGERNRQEESPENFTNIHEGGYWGEAKTSTRENEKRERVVLGKHPSSQSRLDSRSPREAGKTLGHRETTGYTGAGDGVSHWRRGKTSTGRGRRGQGKQVLNGILEKAQLKVKSNQISGPGERGGGDRLQKDTKDFLVGDRNMW